jgi:hypothetical protein
MSERQTPEQNVAAVLLRAQALTKGLHTATHRRDATRTGGGDRADRPGAGRSTAPLHAVSRQLGVAGVSGIPCSAIPRRGNSESGGRFSPPPDLRWVRGGFRLVHGSASSPTGSAYQCVYAWYLPDGEPTLSAGQAATASPRSRGNEFRPSGLVRRRLAYRRMLGEGITR